MFDHSTEHHYCILILEDDPDILEEVEETLTDEGYTVVTARSVHEFHHIAPAQPVDLFLLDVKLPDGNGFDLAKIIRQDSQAGIIMLSGKKTEEIDRVIGLEIGADDYLTKPYAPRELLARISSVLRRMAMQQAPVASPYHEVAPVDDDTIVRFGTWTVNLFARTVVSSSNVDVPFTTAEFELLTIFLEHPQQVLSRDVLLDRVHGRDYSGFDRSIDGLVSRIRKKMPMPPGQPPVIKTVRNIGYVFTPVIRQPKGRS